MTTSATIAVGNAAIPWDGKEKISLYHQRVGATVAKPLTAGTYYKVIKIPAQSYVGKVGFTVATKDSGSSKLTVAVVDTKGRTALITSSAHSYSTAGLYAVVSSGTSHVGKFCEDAGYIEIECGATSTTLVVDVWAEATNLAVNTTNDTDVLYTS